MTTLLRYWRFILVAVVSAGLLAFGHAKVKPMAATVETDQNGARSVMDKFVREVVSDVTAYGNPANLAIGDRRAKSAAIDELSTRMAAELSFRVAPDYVTEGLDAKPVTEAAREFVLSKLREQSERLRFARFWSPDINNANQIGYQFIWDKADAAADSPNERLYRLDMLRRIADVAEDLGVTSVDTFKFVIPPPALTSRVPTTKLAVGQTSGATLLTPRVVLVEIRARHATCLEFLERLQQPVVDGIPGRYLVPEAFTLENPDWKDPADDLITLKATIVAYTVFPDAPLPEASLRAALERDPALSGSVKKVGATPARSEESGPRRR